MGVVTIVFPFKSVHAANVIVSNVIVSNHSSILLLIRDLHSCRWPILNRPEYK